MHKALALPKCVFDFILEDIFLSDFTVCLVRFLNTLSVNVPQVLFFITQANKAVRNFGGSLEILLDLLFLFYLWIGSHLTQGVVVITAAKEDLKLLILLPLLP